MRYLVNEVINSNNKRHIAEFNQMSEALDYVQFVAGVNKRIKRERIEYQLEDIKSHFILPVVIEHNIH